MLLIKILNSLLNNKYEEKDNENITTPTLNVITIDKMFLGFISSKYGASR